MAPEVLEQTGGYDYKADIWSYGITAIELATGTAPYHKYPPMKVLMLTLQNDPPSLDSGAEDKEQYKAYGKTFRKMISECLQKDPSKRPTASELLKHAFFKNKAKDKKYLQGVLVNAAPNPEVKVNKTKSKKPGTSGRLHRNETGDWVWSSDEEDSDDETIQKKGPKNKQLAINEENIPENQRTINLVLRMRNTKRELNDMGLEFQPAKDSADGIANELLTQLGQLENLNNGIYSPGIRSEPYTYNIKDKLGEHGNSNFSKKLAFLNQQKKTAAGGSKPAAGKKDAAKAGNKAQAPKANKGGAGGAAPKKNFKNQGK